MEFKRKTYSGDRIDVSFDTKRCIHAAKCVRGVPAVFDTSRRPWILPDEADADAVAAVIETCPTGALHYERKDGGPNETADAQTSIRIGRNGPLFVRGQARIVNDAGETLLADSRIALCRCGASANKPLCDNSHLEAQFEDAGQPAARDAATDGADAPGLTIRPAGNGPLLLEGAFVLLDADRQPVYQGTKAALCRCGHSSSRPFCDGTHKRVGFEG